MLSPVPQVPLYVAEVIGNSKDSGASKPLSMTCMRRNENGDVERHDFVVKFYGDATNNQRGLARELIASLLGQVLGFDIPNVATIHISDALCASASVWQGKICKSVGTNFGSKLLLEIREEKDIPRSHIEAASQVFAFDMLIQNVDRRGDHKCNWSVAKNGFTLFDHEKTFMCAEPFQIGGIPEPWDFASLNSTQHICYQELKKQSVSFDDFTSKLAILADAIIDEILSRVPDEWQSPEISIIRNHLVKARDGANNFKRSLQEVLG